jgi:hypothetical protein
VITTPPPRARTPEEHPQARPSTLRSSPFTLHSSRFERERHGVAGWQGLSEPRGRRRGKRRSTNLATPTASSAHPRGTPSSPAVHSSVFSLQSSLFTLRASRGRGMALLGGRGCLSPEAVAEESDARLIWQRPPPRARTPEEHPQARPSTLQSSVFSLQSSVFALQEGEAWRCWHGVAGWRTSTTTIVLAVLERSTERRGDRLSSGSDSLVSLGKGCSLSTFKCYQVNKSTALRASPPCCRCGGQT